MIYNLLHLILSFFFKNKSFFIKSILFDVQKYFSSLAVVTNDKHERYILFSNDNVISKELFVKQECEINKFERTIDILNKKIRVKNLYDVGANLGVICIPAIKRNLVNSAFAVEAEPENFNLLKANIILNNLEKKIIAYNFALSEYDDQLLQMELSFDNYGDHRIRKDINFNLMGEESRKIIKIKSKKFDTIFPKMNPLEDLVWIDTQGHEADVLSGANLLIESKVPIVIEFWPYGLERNNNWDKMVSILKRFSHYVDLSESDTKIKELNEINLEILTKKFYIESKFKPALFKDLVLLRE